MLTCDALMVSATGVAVGNVLCHKLASLAIGQDGGGHECTSPSPRVWAHDASAQRAPAPAATQKQGRTSTSASTNAAYQHKDA